jgi:hypothetical protein
MLDKVLKWMFDRRPLPTRLGIPNPQLPPEEIERLARERELQDGFEWWDQA